jgi:hypothetical protein
MGFELFWDGERINGPEAAFFRDKRRVTITPGTRRPIHTSASRSLTTASRLRSIGALRRAIARPPQNQQP